MVRTINSSTTGHEVDEIVKRIMQNYERPGVFGAPKVINEQETRRRTQERYNWEERAKEAAKREGKQYQNSLSKSLHLDIPGMESLLSAGLASACLPIVVATPLIMMKKLKEEQKNKKS